MVQQTEAEPACRSRLRIRDIRARPAACVCIDAFYIYVCRVRMLLRGVLVCAHDLCRQHLQSFAQGMLFAQLLTQNSALE